MTWIYCNLIIHPTCIFTFLLYFAVTSNATVNFPMKTNFYTHARSFPENILRKGIAWTVENLYGPLKRFCQTAP